MKLSFMTFACPAWPLPKVIDAAERHGYHGIEFRCDADHDHGVEIRATAADRKKIRAALDKAGIAACCLATSLQCINDEAIAKAPPLIDLAYDIGAPALRVFCGPLPEGLHAGDAVDRVAQHLRAVAHLATQARVELWLETHDTFCKAADAAAAVRLAEHPGVGVNYDNMHPFRKGETVDATFAALGTLIRHTHFHDAVNHPDKVLITPLGKGDMPMDAMFERLAKSGYTGYLGGEWFNDMYGETPDVSLEQFKNDMTALAERHGVKLGPA